MIRLCSGFFALAAVLAAGSLLAERATTQPADPPEAAGLLAVLRQVDPGQTDARDPRAMTDYLARLGLAREAVDKLKKEYPAIAAREEVRLAELTILFDSSYLEQDMEMKDLRTAAGMALADPGSGRALRATAEYFVLNADLLSRANRKDPASQPEGQPIWVASDLDRRLEFARKYKGLDIARQAFGEVILNRAGSYADRKPLIDEFVASYPEHKLVQATLLAHIAIGEYSRNRDGWAAAKPVADRLLAEYRDQPVTTQVLAAIAKSRHRSEPAAGLAMIEQLTKDFPGDEAVAGAWCELVLAAHSERKPQLEADRLKVLADKFPKSEARVLALASLAGMVYEETGLGAVQPSLAELHKQFPDSQVVARLHVRIALAQMRKSGYQKSAEFIDEVVRMFGQTEDGRHLAGYVSRFKAQATQPE